MRNMKIYDLLVIGGGPAGLGAGIQAAHLGLKHAVLERPEPASRLLLARKVENFPGQNNISGPKLLKALTRQAKGKGIRLITDTCAGIDFKKDCFCINTAKNIIKAKAVISATGLVPKKLNARVASSKLENKYIFYRWTDIPAGFKNKRILVIGGGETAFDQACSLAEKGAKVIIAVRGRKDRVFDELRREAKKLRIQIRYGAEVIKIVENKNKFNIALKIGDRYLIKYFNFCLAAIGGRKSMPQISPGARALLNRGLYLAGDLADSQHRQAAIAFGDGIKKTMEAYEYIRDNGK